jgi:hypothetical protein
MYVWSKTYKLPSLRRAAMAFMGANWVEVTQMLDVVKFSRENNAMFLKVNAKIIRHMTGGE